MPRSADMIAGVEIKELVKHSDERGYFQEIIRSSDKFFKEGFGQLSYSLVHHGVIKAWHAHRVQTQWTYILEGSAKIGLHDLRKDSKTFGITMELLAGDNYPAIVYKFPPGVAHGYKCINGPMLTLYVTSGVYDINDEQRIAHDDPAIGYNWVKEAMIK
jgi:dTDP-4-dehydrorhamnose 3,5-epimerase